MEQMRKFWKNVENYLDQKMWKYTIQWTDKKQAINKNVGLLYILIQINMQPIKPITLPIITYARTTTAEEIEKNVRNYLEQEMRESMSFNEASIL